MAVETYKSNKLTDKRHILQSLAFPVSFVVLLWLVKSAELLFGISLHQFGIWPQSLSGLKGVIFAPFIHGSISHLASNSLPLLVLGFVLFYFYREIAIRVLIWGVIITGLWVWVFARSSYHIGASGVIYQLLGFLFVSGVLRKHPRLMAISLLVAFLYGSLIWGIFPIRVQMSWESHMMGLLAGALLAYFFRGHGPQRPVYSWELEEDGESDVQEDSLEEGEDSVAERDEPT